MSKITPCQNILAGKMDRCVQKQQYLVKITMFVVSFAQIAKYLPRLAILHENWLPIRA